MDRSADDERTPKAYRDSLTPAERSLRGRIGAYRLHALHDPKQTTAKARSAFLARFLDEQPTDLPEPERIRRATAARRSHMAALAYRSARARGKRKPSTESSPPEAA